MLLPSTPKLISGSVLPQGNGVGGRGVKSNDGRTLVGGWREEKTELRHRSLLPTTFHLHSPRRRLLILLLVTSNMRLYHMCAAVQCPSTHPALFCKACQYSILYVVPSFPPASTALHLFSLSKISPSDYFSTMNIPAPYHCKPLTILSRGIPPKQFPGSVPLWWCKHLCGVCLMIES